MDTKICYILSGIPCNGKSTWTAKQNLPIISCDNIRVELFGRNYKFSKANEEIVWNEFYKRVENQTSSFIVDNTNCKQIYIQQVKRILLQNNFNWEIKRFDISLYKAYYRNVIRYIKTGKFIPFKVIKNMYNNYKKLWNNE